jgi:hypothetical protein
MLKLILKDFMCHENLVLEFTEPVGLIVGANGVGKTAIREALELAYLGTGQLRGISTKKSLGELSVRDGAKSCSVTIETDTMRLERTMKRDGSQELWVAQAVEVKETGKGLVQAFGEPRQIPPRRDGKSQIGNMAADALRVILEPTEFFRLDEARRREMILTATSEKATAAEVEQALNDMLEPEGDEDKEAIKDAAGFVLEFGMREAEEHAGEVRRRAKRDLGELDPKPPVHADGLAPELCQAIEARPLKEFESRLEEVRILHTRAVASEATSTGVIEGKLQEAQAAQAAAEGANYEEIDKEAPKVLKAATKRAEAATMQVEKAWAKMQAKENELVALADQEVADLAPFKKPKSCPAVSFQYSCPVKKATFEKAMEQATAPSAAKNSDRKEAREKLEPEILKLQEAHAGTVEALEAAQTQLKTATDRAEKEKAREIRDGAKMEAMKKARERTQELEGQLLEAQAVEVDGDGETAEALAERVQRGHEMVELKRAWDIAEALYRNQTTRKTELELQVTRWNEIAKALKPDEIETKLGGGAKAAFLELLDQAQDLAGLIRLNESFDLYVQTSMTDSATRHPLQLSTSQRLAVGIAIQHAFARLIEFPILCCDAIDTFDASHKSAWAGFAAMVGKDYQGGVLGISTLPGAADPIAPPPGFESYYLHDGTVTHLVAAEKE